MSGLTATRFRWRLRPTMPRDAIVLAGVAIALVALGAVMVLSASSVENLVTTGDPFALARRHSAYAIAGTALMLILSQVPARLWRRWAWLLLGAAILMQLLVFSPLGYESGGNRNWVRIGSFAAQPSEFLKLALIVWVAHIIAAKGDAMRRWHHAAIPIVPVAALALGTVMLGKDLGTVLIMGAIVLGACFFGGIRLRFIVVSVMLATVAAVAVAISGGSRQSRIETWLSGCSADSDAYLDLCWQTVHGWNALANGGVTGVGIGNSMMKWGWLPEANNDFIFSIIGEELGLIGAIIVVLLFVLIGALLARALGRSGDPFTTTVLGGILVWIVGQAFVNIAVVLGMLPVLGVPLPLLSAGGSSLIAILAALGVALSIMRERGDAASPA